MVGDGSIDFERRTIRRVYWRLVPLLFVMVLFNYLDRLNLGFAQLQMGDELKISDAAFGIAGSVFYLGYMVLEIPSNLILDKVGARRWIPRILLTWGAVAALTAFVFNDSSLYVARFLLGVMEAGFLPGVAIYVSRWFPRRHRATAVAGYIIGSQVASVVGGPLSASIMTYADDAFGLRGWQWMFLIEGIGAIVVGIIAIRALTERPADARWLEPEQRDWLEQTLAAERAATGSQKASVRVVVGDPRVWILAIMFGCALVGIYGLGLWLPQIIDDFGHLSTMQVGFLSAVPPLCGVIGTVIVGRSSDRHNERRKHLAFVYGMGAAAIIASALVPSHVVCYLLLCVMGLFLYSGNSIFWALGSSIRSGAAGAAAVALINTIAQFGGVFGPSAIGFIRTASGSFTIALLTIGGFLIVATVLALLLRVDRVPESVQGAGSPQADAEHA
jgi:D-galactonate transporter